MKYETRLVAVLGVTFGLAFFAKHAVNFLMPFISSDLHFSNQQIGRLVSAISFTCAISGFLGGVLTDRLGNRKIFLIVRPLPPKHYGGRSNCRHDNAKLLEKLPKSGSSFSRSRAD